MLSCSCLTRCFNRPALLEQTLRAKVNFFVLRGSCHLGSSRGLCLAVHNLELCLCLSVHNLLFRPNPLPKWSPSANVAQVEMSRGTLTCLSQTGEGFLLTFHLGRQDVNNKNNHGMDQPRRQAPKAADNKLKSVVVAPWCYTSTLLKC